MMDSLFEWLGRYATQGDKGTPRTRGQQLALLVLVVLAYALLYGVYLLLAAGAVFLVLAFGEIETAVRVVLLVLGVGAVVVGIGAIFQGVRFWRKIRAANG